MDNSTIAVNVSIVGSTASPIAVDSTTRSNVSRPDFIVIDAQALLERILMGYPEYRLAKDINLYGYITEVVVGSIANILALIVMLGLTRLPTCNYMAALALVDLSVLLGPCLIRWLLTQNIDPRSSSTAVCRFLNFQTYWSFSLSAWLLVAMTIDRYIAITFPLKAIRISTPRHARIIVLVLMFAMVLVNGHFLLTLNVEKQPNLKASVCVAYDENRHFIEEVWPWIDATVYSFLPFFLLIIFNFLIIRSHRKSLKVNSSLKGSKNGKLPATTVRVNRKLTITLLVVAFTFIAVTAPKVILMIIRPTVFNFKPTPNSIDFGILARYTLASSLVNILMFGNHCINFFLYVLSGQKFRQQLVHIIKNCGTYRRRHVQVAPADFVSSDTTNNTASLRRTSQSQTQIKDDAVTTKDMPQPNGKAAYMRQQLPTIAESRSDLDVVKVRDATMGNTQPNGVAH